MEKGAGLCKYFLCEFISTVVLATELQSLKKCSLNLSAVLLHGGALT